MRASAPAWGRRSISRSTTALCISWLTSPPVILHRGQPHPFRQCRMPALCRTSCSTPRTAVSRSRSENHNSTAACAARRSAARISGAMNGFAPIRRAPRTARYLVPRLRAEFARHSTEQLRSRVRQHGIPAGSGAQCRGRVRVKGGAGPRGRDGGGASAARAGTHGARSPRDSPAPPPSRPRRRRASASIPARC